MIQRIQTIFLALAAGASLGLFGLPFAEGTSNEQGSFFSDGVFNLNDNTGLMIAFIAAGAIAFLSIFLFNNRGLQMKVVLLSILALLVGMGLAGFLVYPQLSTLEAFNVKLGAFLPILGIILAGLAYRSIKKDEKLVQSMDRLR